MSTFEIFIIGIGLAMDAFAASICKGLQQSQASVDKTLKIGFCFGFFQAIMPLLGYFLGASFAKFIADIDHRIAFILLSIIGGQMIRESRDASCEIDKGFDFKSLFMMGVATSIDAMIVGVSFAFLKVDIYKAALIIGLVTFALSSLGFKIGHKLGTRSKQVSELIGGLVLIGMGVKILIEHLTAA